AAGMFWVQRRRRELTMLSAHGVGAGALAVKAVAESLPALVAGVAIGWGGAWALVHWAGPDPVLSGEAAPGAALGAAGTLLAARRPDARASPAGAAVGALRTRAARRGTAGLAVARRPAGDRGPGQRR